MYSVNPSYYELGSNSNSLKFLEGGGVVSCSTNMGNASMSMVRWPSTPTPTPSPSPSPSPSPEEKASKNKKIHSEAERRRRKRINGHLSTLRTLLPNSTTLKTDKASLLAEVVRRLRELKKTTTELTATSGSSSDNDRSCCCCQSKSRGSRKEHHHDMLPSEADELKLCYCECECEYKCEEEGDSGTIKATVSCEDRPELVSDITRAVRSVQGKVVRAEMATVGGRTKSVLWVQVLAAGGGGGGGGGELGMLQRALKVVLDRSSLSMTGLGLGLGQTLPGNKRPRLSQYHPC